MRRNRHSFNIWEIAILRAIASLGGMARTQEIYCELRKFIQFDR